MLPLETLAPGEPSGGVVYLRIEKMVAIHNI